MTEMSASGVQVGQMVPDFKLETFEPGGKSPFGEFTLASARKEGKWTVLFFYPADFTFVCATEFAALAGRNEDFKKLGVELVTVSTDTKFTHKAWQENEGELAKVNYKMGADRTGNVARLFGVYMCDSGLCLRGTFIISPEGKLMGSEVNFLNLGRNVDELYRKVEANVFLSKHGDEVCPANWKKPGDRTLKPGPEMVGKVHEAMNG